MLLHVDSLAWQQAANDVAVLILSTVAAIEPPISSGHWPYWTSDPEDRLYSSRQAPQKRHSGISGCILISLYVFFLLLPIFRESASCSKPIGKAPWIESEGRCIA